MINYRTIFNPNYNYIGLIIIIILALLIIIIEKDTLASLQQFSKISLIAGIITLILALALNLLIQILIPSSYKIFIQVITKNVINNLYFYAILIIVISIIFNLIISVLAKPKDTSTSSKI